ncbi:MAG: hypothetical protein Q8M94_13875, partial [Ignavibacteria bacterium]|nr:hypothetical protein [Ignavibacteria bacterium]
MLDAHSKAVYDAFENAINAGKFDDWTKDADIMLKFSANGISVSHLGPEDIVSNIVKSTLDGTRHWDMEKVNSIDAYMNTAMRSEVWNAKQKSKKSTSLIELAPKDVMEDYDEDFALKQAKDKEADDFTIHFENKDLFEICYNALNENVDHQLIFLAMKDFGYSDNKGIAEYYGIAIDKVVYLKRELLKKL